MNAGRLVLLLVAVAVAVAGCAAREVLTERSAAVPAGVDLSGQWLLRDTEGTTQRSAREALVHVFLETGKSIKITQTDSGLFISFDRSIVEEYRFGEHREVSVGEISADRVSGWEGQSYVVETLDRDGTRLIDKYTIAADGQELRRNIEIVSRSRRELQQLRTYDRVR